MADDERQTPHDPDASLELPSLRSAFRRRRRRPPDPSEPLGPSGPGETTAAIEAAGDASAESARTDAGVPAHMKPLDRPAVSPGPVGLPETRPEVTSPVLTATDQTPPPARRRIRAHSPGPVAAVVVGAVVGLVLVGLTAASLRVCTSMRGTSSCGKPGILLLLVVTAAVVVLGSLLLRLGGVAAHGSTSFLGVGLLVVVILLALLPVLDEWWVAIAVPLLAMVTFAASYWLTSTYTDSGDRPH
jgi:hypothetical protein